MIDRTAAEEALGAVRDLVSADGGDIVLIEVTTDTIALRLELATAECAECVMPRRFLETVAFDMMKTRLPGLSGVSIEDPREGG